MTTANTGMRPSLRQAIARLARGNPRRVPFVKQLEVADCAAACLAMVLRHHGRHVELRDVRERLGGGTGGTTADRMLAAARHFGLRGRGVSLEIEGMKYLGPGSILHWGFRHFVVFERIRGNMLEALDPAVGRRRIPLAQVARSFTGVALVLERDDGFVPAGPGRGRLRSYFRQILEQHGIIARIMLLSGGLRLFAMAAPLLTATVVDRVVPRNDQHLLFVVTTGLLAIIGFQFLSELVRSHLLLQLRTNLDTKLTIGFLDHMVSLPFAYFQRRTAGDLLQRVASNGIIRQTLASTLMSSILDGLFAVLYLALILTVHTGLGFLTLALATAQTAVFLGGRHKVTQLVRESLEVGARSQNELVQILAGIETLKLAGAEQRAVDRWVDSFVDGLNVGLRRARLTAVLGGLGGLLRSLSPLALLAVGALAVMRGELSLGTMLAVNALAAGFLGPLSALVTAAFSVQELAGHVERIDDVLGEKQELGRDRALAAGLSGHVQVESISFRYSDDGPLVLRDVDLEIEPGSMVAIVGRSGSGKSTLASLLLGMYRPTQGRVLYDGVDLEDIDRRDLRARIGMVPQHPFIFGRSVRENIAMQGDDTSLAAIVEAARKACIHDDIVALPMAYDTVVADGGASLSGGQRQRIAIARALLRAPALVVLDEGTSSVDNATELAIMNNIASLQCARVLIAHRLSTVARADKIVVLDRGRIVETGTHGELISREGVYYQLVATQANALATNEDVYRGSPR